MKVLMVIVFTVNKDRTTNILEELFEEFLGCSIDSNKSNSDGVIIGGTPMKSSLRIIMPNEYGYYAVKSRQKCFTK